MQTTKKIFRINSIFPCLLGMAISFAQAIDKFSCDFEDLNSCKWTQDSSDEFKWIRHQGNTDLLDTGPTADHTKGVTYPVNNHQRPLSIQHRGGRCIHVLGGGYNRPKDGQPLVVYYGCEPLSRLEFQLWPSGTLMHTRHGMCVKPTGPVTDGVSVGVFSSCNVTDKWSWTAQGSLQYKKKMCLKPETGGSNPGNGVELVLDSTCNEPQNVFQFMATSGWYLYIEALSSREPNDAARLISPSTTEPKSCLSFFYCMYGVDVGKLQVYVKSGGKMGLPVWSSSGNHGNKWYQAQVAMNNQTASYQYVIEGVRGKGPKGDIAIDDISLRHSCTAGENQPSKPTSADNNGSKKVTTTFTVSTTPAILPSQTTYLSEENQPSKPAILPSQTTYLSEDKGTTDDSSRIIIALATTVGCVVFLCIVLIVLLIKYKRRKRASKSSAPVSIPLTVATPQQSLPIDQGPCYETEDISAEGRTSHYEEVGIPSNYETPGQNETYEEPKISPENPGYAELDKNRLRGRNTTDDGTYQKLLKRDSGYVIPAHERRESYEDIKMGRNLPGYKELDLSKRKTEESQRSAYQKLVKI